MGSGERNNFLNGMPRKKSEAKGSSGFDAAFVLSLLIITCIEDISNLRLKMTQKQPHCSSFSTSNLRLTETRIYLKIIHLFKNFSNF